MLYDLIRPALFKLDAERAHRLTIRALSIVGGSGSVPKVRPRPFWRMRSCSFVMTLMMPSVAVARVLWMVLLRV